MLGHFISSCLPWENKNVSLSNSPLAICPHTLRGIRGYRVGPEVAADTQSHWSTQHTWGRRTALFGHESSRSHWDTCAGAEGKLTAFVQKDDSLSWICRTEVALCRLSWVLVVWLLPASLPGLVTPAWKGTERRSHADAKRSTDTDCCVQPLQAWRKQISFLSRNWRNNRPFWARNVHFCILTVDEELEMCSYYNMSSVTIMERSPEMTDKLLQLPMRAVLELR